jgi:VanZ family protein
MSRKLYGICALLLVLVIYAFSSIPDLTLVDHRAISPYWKQWINAHTYRFGSTGFFSYAISPHPDYVLHKIGHVIAFGMLGLTLFWAMRSASGAVSLTILLASADELHQHFVAGRSSRLGDILLDTTAALMFICLVRLYSSSCSKKIRG